jgi:integrase
LIHLVQERLLAGCLGTEIEGQGDLFHAMYFIAKSGFATHFLRSYAEFPKAHCQDHIILLSTQAVAVLKDLHPLTGHRGKVFPSERGEGRSISEKTCRQALRSMGYLDHVPHGFRASARTLIREALDYDKEVIERQLSHGSDEELGGSYDRTQFFAEPEKMMQDWADLLDKLRTGA